VRWQSLTFPPKTVAQEVIVVAITQIANKVITVFFIVILNTFLLIWLFDFAPFINVVSELHRSKVILQNSKLLEILNLRKSIKIIVF